MLGLAKIGFDNLTQTVIPPKDSLNFAYAVDLRRYGMLSR